MKIHLDMTGLPLTGPDFPMLRACLRAAQASTPTVTANERALAKPNAAEALTRLFGDRIVDVAQTAALHGSFNPASVRGRDDEEPQR